MADVRRTSFTIPRRAARWLVIGGVVLVFVLVALPVRATIADDPVLRLRRLDPELAQLRVEVSCGRPLGALDTEARSLAFHEVARAEACREAGRRRVAVATALGGLLVVLGLLGLQASPKEPAAPAAAKPARAKAKADTEERGERVSTSGD